MRSNVVVRRFHHAGRRLELRTWVHHAASRDRPASGSVPGSTSATPAQPPPPVAAARSRSASYHRTHYVDFRVMPSGPVAR